jgi:glycosyltransferase involved in cell wall biosynthesis
VPKPTVVSPLVLSSTSNPEAKVKVVLVYDWVSTDFGGAEKVLLALHQIFPTAPLYTSIYNQDQAQWADDFIVKTSWLQKVPTFLRRHRWLAPLMPLAFESLDLSEYDIIISITSSAAKGILTKPNQLHICYLLTPTRYLHTHQDEYLQKSVPSIWLRWLATPILKYLKKWDAAAALRPDYIIPISRLVGERCQTYYHRQALAPIYPPVELPFTSEVTKNQSPTPSTQHKLDRFSLPNTYYLCVARLVGYKKLDLAIKACQKLDRNLVIVGEGPDLKRLYKIANQKYQQQDTSNSKIIFTGSLTQSELDAIWANARGFILPTIEDFGVSILEAAARGVPIITHQQTGATELLSNTPGLFLLSELTISDLVKNIVELEKKPNRFNNLQKKVAKYDTTEFCSTFGQTIGRLWRQFADERHI